jgi:hypothetical protein
MAKFKIGDRVRIVKTGDMLKVYLNCEAVITSNEYFSKDIGDGVAGYVYDCNIGDFKTFGPSSCQCSLRTRLVGDGCQYCNPKLHQYFKKETLREIIHEIDDHLKDHKVVPLDRIDWDFIKEVLVTYIGDER